MKKYKNKLNGGYHPAPEVAVELANWKPLKSFGETKPLDGGIYNTDTMRFYKNGLTIIVVIRGTRNLSDVLEDFTINQNKLDTTSRYKGDKQKLLEVQSIYPKGIKNFGYYGIGHSLGGAIMDRFLENGLLDFGISFNPAVEPKNYTENEQSGLNQRIYNKNDIVYEWFGKNIQPDQYKQAYESFMLGREVEPIILEDNQKGIFKNIKAHMMSNIDPEQVIQSTSPPGTPRGSPGPSPGSSPRATAESQDTVIEMNAPMTLVPYNSGKGKYRYSEPDTYIYMY
jgi:hypothetical protein